VTAVSARVDPTRSRLTVTTTVQNAGRHPAMLGSTPTACCLVSIESGVALRVPPGDSAGTDWTLSLETCDGVAAATTGAAPVAVDPLLSTEIGLAALAGPGLPTSLDGFQPSSGLFVEQMSPTGVVLARDAGAALSDALRRACGGLSQPVMLLAPYSVRVDRAASRVDMEALLDVSPGLVRSVRLETNADSSLADQYRPLWSRIGPLTPDRTGQVKVRLSYQLTGASSVCLPNGGVLPPITFVLEVPEGGTVRTVLYSGMPSLTDDPGAVPRFCPSS
jgi:hypothetical protein